MRPRKGRGVDAVSQPQRHLRRSVFIGRREPMTLQNGSGRDQPADRSRKTVSIEKRTQKKKTKRNKTATDWCRTGAAGRTVRSATARARRRGSRPGRSTRTSCVWRSTDRRSRWPSASTGPPRLLKNKKKQQNKTSQTPAVGNGEKRKKNREQSGANEDERRHGRRLIRSHGFVTRAAPLSKRERRRR